MRGLTAADLLGVYEQGRRVGGARRALVMLEASGDAPDPGPLASISVGERNSMLMRLREATFGPEVHGVATCPGCGERLEVSFNVGDADRSESGHSNDWRLLEADGFEIRYRLPTASDLVAVEGLPEGADGRRVLIERCVEVRRVGRRRSASGLPSALIERVGEEIARADPEAIADVQLACPSCGQEHAVMFDIAAFLWSEIEARAPRLLTEVHELASAYGWGEGEILALSPWRRRAYLEMVGA